MVKLENTLENKLKFFGLYIGQKVLCYKDANERLWVNEPNTLMIEPDWEDYLLLRSLSSLSNKEASNMGLAGFTRKVKDYINVLSQYEADILRANGYAIPWCFLSVEELINYGWIKLKE